MLLTAIMHIISLEMVVFLANRRLCFCCTEQAAGVPVAILMISTVTTSIRKVLAAAAVFISSDFRRNRFVCLDDEL